MLYGNKALLLSERPCGIFSIFYIFCIWMCDSSLNTGPNPTTSSTHLKGLVSSNNCWSLKEKNILIRRRKIPKNLNTDLVNMNNLKCFFVPCFSFASLLGTWSLLVYSCISARVAYTNFHSSMDAILASTPRRPIWIRLRRRAMLFDCLVGEFRTWCCFLK